MLHFACSNSTLGLSAITAHWWVTRTEAAELLDVSERSVDRHRSTGELGYYRGPVPGFDAALRFWRPDVVRLALTQNREC